MPYAPLARLLFQVGLVALATSCTHLPTPLGTQSRRSNPAQQLLAITQVNVIPLTEGGGVLPNRTVLIRNGQIVALTGPVPAGAQVIDGRGKWLMPGLIDMYVHVPTDTHFGPKIPTHGAPSFWLRKM